jgi:hypothetical protein
MLEKRILDLIKAEMKLRELVCGVGRGFLVS